MSKCEVAVKVVDRVFHEYTAGRDFPHRTHTRSILIIKNIITITLQYFKNNRRGGSYYEMAAAHSHQVKKLNK